MDLLAGVPAMLIFVSIQLVLSWQQELPKYDDNGWMKNHMYNSVTIVLYGLLLLQSILLTMSYYIVSVL